MAGFELFFGSPDVPFVVLTLPRALTIKSMLHRLSDSVTIEFKLIESAESDHLVSRSSLEQLSFKASEIYTMVFVLVNSPRRFI